LEKLIETFKTVPTILVVDDDSGIREIIGMTLERMGANTLEADSAETAITVLQENPVDVVISDIRMQGKSGLDLLSRCHVQGIDVPFIFLTGYDGPEYMMKAVRLGAMDFLLKPLSPEELHLVLTRILAITYRQNQISEIMASFGDKIDSKKRNELTDLKRQISMIRSMHANKRDDDTL